MITVKVHGPFYYFTKCPSPHRKQDSQSKMQKKEKPIKVKFDLYYMSKDQNFHTRN